MGIDQTKRFILFLAIAGFLLTSCYDQNAPKPFGPVPSAQQVEWQKMEYYMFVHFGPNTFTDVEWGNGSEDPKVFQPTALDCMQWAKIAKKAGMRGIVLTAKHHDGFCLWPSNFSTHTIRESGWQGGKGDILKDLSEACKLYGLKFGVYLSPWDRNHPSYGTPEYNMVFANTLTEVLTSYGPIFEQWFDGANGDGANAPEYDWDLFHTTVYKYQPDAIIFSDLGPGCRWMGNEAGRAGETNWSRLDTVGFTPGHGAPSSDTLNQGNKYGHCWIPAEVDVSIRPGWFYSPSTDDKVKTASELMDIWYTSVGRNANLILNVPPDRTGKINPIDSARLMEFRKAREEAFRRDYAKMSRAFSADVRGNKPKYAAANVVDGKYDSYWTTDDAVTSASFTISFRRTRSIHMALIQEYIPLGQRVEEFSIDCRADEDSPWTEVYRGTTIGNKRIVQFPETEASFVRFNILKSLACPVINNVEIY